MFRGQQTRDLVKSVSFVASVSVSLFSVYFFFYEEKEMGNYYENYVTLRWENRKLGHVALKQKT